MSTFKAIMLAIVAAMMLPHVPSNGGGSRAEEVHPVLVNSCLIGGTVSGKWMAAGEVAPKLQGGEKYNFYTLTARAGESIGDKPKRMADYCPETMEIELSPKPTEGVVFAIGGQWNALPRAPQVLSNNEQVYKAAVADVLKSKRFSKPRINITRVLRIDVDGDGIEEVLVSASHYAGGLGSDTGPMAIRARGGDYSVVFLRKLMSGKVQNIVVAGEFYPLEGDKGNPPSQYIVSAVGDVDGDGAMEVIVESNYYEGGGSTVYSIKGNKVEEMTSCGCGA
ncbi:MAG TPA: hypothetical protein VF658_08190 [Pyrinomonadaceae bacterium]|jgi:hypothetical protein